jgi:hypothetical protein
VEYLRKLKARHSADALRRRVRRAQLRVRRFQFLQLAEQAVVLGVADAGIVEDVVAVVVFLQQPPQFGGALERSFAHW